MSYVDLFPVGIGHVTRRAESQGKRMRVKNGGPLFWSYRTIGIIRYGLSHFSVISWYYRKIE